MRLIQTSFYYPAAAIRAKIGARDLPPSPRGDRGFTVIWFSTHTNRPVPAPQIDVFRWEFPILGDVPLPISRRFIDLCLIGRKTVGLAFGQALQNPDIVEEILQAPIVIERSPPDIVPLIQLLTSGSYVSIGSYVGYRVARNSTWLLYFSVPSGVIIMGAAAGIANGLANGLATAIQRTIESAF